MSGRAWKVGLAGLVLASVALGVALPLAGSGSATPPLAIGTELDRATPDLRLVDEQGRTTSLAAYRGKFVVLAPFLTLCHEVCPMTTGALEQIEHAVRAAGVDDRVAILEVTVDPWRDSPARLRAYRKLTGVDVALLTGTPSQIARFWRFFGVAYERTPQGAPPDLDWWTHAPETFDVGHTDGLFFLDPEGRERIAVVGMPSVGGHLSQALAGLLNDQGRENLANPEAPWTVGDALADLGHLVGQPIRTA